MTGPNDTDKYIKELPRAERLLIAVRKELYEDSWDNLREDLRRVTKQSGRITDGTIKRVEQDLDTIDRLETFEKENGVDLADYIDFEDLYTT